MFLKKYKPITNGTRHRLSLTSFNINWNKKKNLISGFKKNAGRNINGAITVRHKRRGVSYNYINIDFKRRFFINLSICHSLVKDANRSALIALIKYSNGAYSYILAPHGLLNGSSIQTLIKPEIFSTNYQIGYHVFLKNLQTRSIFCNLEITPSLGGKYARAAGTYCVLLSNDFEKNLAKIKLPSNKLITISLNCMVTLGRVSNIFHKKEIIGKAGRNVLNGLRPSVRGVAMNPVDHPHGGRTKTNSPEVTPWGKVTKKNK